MVSKLEIEKEKAKIRITSTDVKVINKYEYFDKRQETKMLIRMLKMVQFRALTFSFTNVHHFW